VFTDAVGVVQVLDKHSGKLKWKTDVGKAIVLSLAADGGMVVAATSNELVGLSGRTGKVIWRQPIQLYGRFRHTPPFIRDAVVYVFSKDFHLIALDADMGDVRWKLKASSRQQPVVQSKSIYLINENRSLYCRDIAKAVELGHSHKEP
jgi:outer membrane protein assembly factor BamB